HKYSTHTHTLSLFLSLTRTLPPQTHTHKHTHTHTLTHTHHRPASAAYYTRNGEINKTPCQESPFCSRIESETFCSSRLMPCECSAAQRQREGLWSLRNRMLSEEREGGNKQERFVESGQC